MLIARCLHRSWYPSSCRDDFRKTASDSASPDRILLQYKFHPTAGLSKLTRQYCLKSLRQGEAGRRRVCAPAALVQRARDIFSGIPVVVMCPYCPAACVSTGRGEVLNRVSPSPKRPSGTSPGEVLRCYPLCPKIYFEVIDFEVLASRTQW